MLCATRVQDRHKVRANDVTKADGPFACPECTKEVRVRKCRLKVDHFAHLPPVTCQYGRGETEAHRACKLAIFDALSKQAQVTKLELERYLGEVRPDVSCCIAGTYVAIEVQVSDLPYETILRRTAAYARKRIYLLWVAQWQEAMHSVERYSPRLWERWCHAAYFGRVYYWIGESLVVPCHFDPYLIEVESSEFYNSDGDHVSVGGYSRYSKRFRTLAEGRVLDIAHDFEACEHRGFAGGQIEIPPCRLYRDKARNFDELRIKSVVVAPSETEDYEHSESGNDEPADDTCPW